jgi:hypothetical protein
VNAQDAEEFTQSLGQIIGGSWRQVAIGQRLGVSKALGLTTEQWVNKRLGGYVKLARDDRREAVKELRVDGYSNVEIGKVLGVNEGTVRHDLSSENSEGKDEKAHENEHSPSDDSENSEGKDEKPCDTEIKTLDAVAALAIDAKEHSTQRNVTGVFGTLPHAERVPRDLYQTPPEAVRALLRVETISGPIWECACGPGSIARELRQAGHTVHASDIHPDAYGCPDARGGVDFLTEARAPDGVQTILTNPPYLLAADFVRHALTLAPRVVMLLRLLFLEGQERTDLIDGGHLQRVHLFIDRVPLIAGCHEPEGSQLAQAWFVWNRNYHGPIEVRRIWCREKEAEAAE